MKKLDEAVPRDTIIAYRDSMIAHPLDKDFGAKKIEDSIPLKFCELDTALDRVTLIAKFISEVLMRHDISYIVDISLSFGALNQLEFPFLEKSNFKDLRDFWDQMQSDHENIANRNPWEVIRPDTARPKN